MTPFQRQVIEQTKVKENEQKEQERQQIRQQSSGRQQNARAGTSAPSSGSNQQAETVRYINTQQNPEYFDE